MTKKQTIIYYIAVIVLITIFFVSCDTTAGEENNERVESAIAIQKIYHEEGDFCSMVFETTDGNQWIIDETVCPIGVQCEIFFDTKGTYDKKDDEIIAINANIF